MPAKTTELTIRFSDREPLSMTCALNSQTLKQICYGYACRDHRDDELLYLELEGAKQQRILFKRSSLVEIESSEDLPRSYFDAPVDPIVDDFLDLNIDRRMIEWGLESLKRGRSKQGVFRSLHDLGMPWDDIVRLLDYEPDHPLGITAAADTESILPLAGSGIDPAFQWPSKHIELYQIPEFIDPQECRRFIDELDTAKVEQGSEAAYRADSHRTADSYVFPGSGNRSALVRQHQQRLCDLLNISTNFAEPLRCQSYSKTKQNRAHVDYIYDPESPDTAYLSPDGTRRTGQRAWTALVYLTDGERGSGTWFSRIKKEFFPNMGTALIWKNTYPSGNPNPFTVHAALPAGSATKKVLAQWIRDKI